jgi:hypothetical protein
MELTGKCKENFNIWFTERHEGDFEYLTVGANYHAVHLECLRPSMQYGVYVDFFDSVWIYMSINPIENDAYERMYQVYEDENHIISCETRPEARTAAIEKANEIYNYKL